MNKVEELLKKATTHNELEKNLDPEIALALMSGRITNSINRRLTQELKNEGLDLTAAQTSILYALWHGDGVTQKKLADWTYKDKPSITRLLDGMEKDGMIERKQDANDRRTNKIFLTEKSKQVSKAVLQATVKALSDGCKGLTKDEFISFQKVLKLVFFNLEEANGPETDE